MAVYTGNNQAQAQLTTLYSFTGVNGDGEYPFPKGQMIFDSSGNLYGTAPSGGSDTTTACSSETLPTSARVM